MAKITIGLTGGGTAGHIWPTIEVGKALKAKEPKARIVYFGLKNSLEEELAKKAGFEFFSITSGKWHRFFSFSNLFTPLKIGCGICQARALLRKEDVKVLFAKGGFVSFPMVLAAYSLKIPIIGHESDSIMGKTNAYLLRFMKKMAVAFPCSLYPKRLRPKLFHAGIPIRSDFFKIKNRKSILSKLNLDSGEPILVITGGSLGAMFLNELVWQNIDYLLKKVQVVHLTGKQGIVKAKEIKAKLPQVLQKKYHIFAFSYKMPLFLAAADLVISRAGANTLFELAFLKKAVLFIPYPYAAQNHQYFNAKFATSLGGAKMFVESRFDPKKFWQTVSYLIAHSEEREKMGNNLFQLFYPHSAERIAQEILALLKDKKDA